MSRSILVAIIGPLITIVTLGGTMLYTQGSIVEKIEHNEQSAEDNRKKIMTNRDKVQDVELGQASIEAKLDMMLTILEDL